MPEAQFPGTTLPGISVNRGNDSPLEGCVDIPATGAIGSRKERKLLRRGYYLYAAQRVKTLLSAGRPNRSLIEKSELRELLDEVYLDALEPAGALANL
jgi:hypothetical protein